MKPGGIFIKICLIALALAVPACTGAIPAEKTQDPNWVDTPSAQGTNWSLYMDTHGGGR